MPWWSRIRNAFRGSNAELDEELEFHLQMRTEAHQRAGLPPGEARRAACRDFGNPLLLRERTRDADLFQWLDTARQDLRHAARSFAKTPGLSAVVILSLALGIGANTALFTITNAMLLRTLPVPDPQQIYTLQLGENDSATYAIWQDFRHHQDVFHDVFAWSSERFDTSQGGEARPIPGAFASGGLYPTLRLEPALGRGLTPQDDPASVVLGYDYWQRAYGGDPAVIGRSLRLDGKPFQIIGVAPAGFHGIATGERFDVLLPLAAEPYLRGGESVLPNRGYWWLVVMGRLPADVPPAQAEARLQSLGAGVMERTLPPTWRSDLSRDYLKRRCTLASAARGLSYVRDSVRLPVLLLNAVVLLVLLIACANVANLLLARSAARRREMAIRVALGASRGRVARQVLTESVLLALAGGGLGFVLAPAAARLLLRAATTRQSELVLDLRPDPVILLFTLTVAVVCGLLFGAAPAWRASQTPPQSGLCSGSGAAGDRRGRLRGALVGLQVALSLVLLIGAGLLLSTLRNLMHTDLGFQPENVVLMDIDVGRSGLAEGARLQFYEDLLARLRAVPGVEAASASQVTPLAGNTWQADFHVESGGGRVGIHSHYNGITPGFFHTLVTPLLAGRDFTAADGAQAPLVAVVNETFARRALAALSAHRTYKPAAVLGLPLLRRAVPVTRGATPVQQVVEIVGVVRDAKYRTIRGAVPPTVYMPIAQLVRAETGLSYELRSALDLASLAPALRDAVQHANPRAAYTARTFASQARDGMRTERLVAAFSSLFGVLALLLAAIGLYGVLSYSVAQRCGEIGIRVALGATPANIRGWVVRQSLATVLGGAVAGLLLAAWAAGWTRTLLYGVQPGDPLVYAASLVLLLTVAALAAYLPAHRATCLDPVRALHHE